MDPSCATEDNIRVIARLRPTSNSLATNKSCVTIPSPGVITAGNSTYAFDAIAPSSTTQEEIFESAARPIADACLMGFNGTIFAYGQTGSGKTYTIHGPENSNATLRGLLPRTLDYVFKKMREAEANSGNKLTYTTKASFLEIYNERIYDLLDTTSSVPSFSNNGNANNSNENSGSLQIREHKIKGVFVEGLTETVVTNPEEAHTIVSQGIKNRTTGATNMNRESSRSHSVFTLLIEASERAGTVTKSRVAQFHLIDLAGSERQKLTQAAGDRLKEAGQINKSLSALGGVISALVDIAQGKTRHVHYRDSKLTLLLRDSLGGNSKTSLIATVSPTEDCLPETLSTLRFAARAKLVKNKAVVNEDTTGSVASLQAEIRTLKAQLNELKAMALLSSSNATNGNNGTTNNNNVTNNAALVTSITEMYQLSNGVLNAWDEVLTDTLKESGKKGPVKRNGSIVSTFTPLNNISFETADVTQWITRLREDINSTGTASSAIGTTALAALDQATKKLYTVMGGNSSNNYASLTLEAASAAYDRLCDLEEKFGAVWAEKEETDSTIAILQAQTDAVRAEKQAFEKLVDEQKRVVEVITTAWETVQDQSTGSKTNDTVTPATDDETKTVETVTASTTVTMDTKTTSTTAGMSKLQQMYQAMRRPSVVASSSTTNSAANSRRPSVSSVSSSTVSTTTATSRRPSVTATTTSSSIPSRRPSVSEPSSASNIRRPSTSGASLSASCAAATVAHNASSSNATANSKLKQPAMRRPSVSTGSSSTVVTTPSVSSTSTTTTTTVAPKEDFGRLLEAYRTAASVAMNSTFEREMLDLKAENAKLKERLATFEPHSAWLNCSTTTADSSAPVLLSRPAFNALLGEMSCLLSEASALREHVVSRCDASIYRKALDGNAAAARELERQTKEAEARMQAEWDRLTAERAASAVEYSEMQARIADLEASNCELQAELESKTDIATAAKSEAQEAQIRYKKVLEQASDASSSTQGLIENKDCEIRALQNELTRLRETSGIDVANAESALAATRVQVQELQLQITLLEKSFVTKEETLKTTHTKAIDTVVRQFEALQNEHQQLKNSFELLQNENIQYHEQKQQLEAEYTAVSSALADAQVAAARVPTVQTVTVVDTEGIKQWETKYTSLQQQWEIFRTEKEQTVQTYETQLTELRTKVDTLSSTIAMSTMNSSSTSNSSEANSGAGPVGKALRNANVEITKLKTQLQDSQTNETKLKETLRSVQQQLKEHVGKPSNENNNTSILSNNGGTTMNDVSPLSFTSTNDIAENVSRALSALNAGICSSPLPILTSEVDNSPPCIVNTVPSTTVNPSSSTQGTTTPPTTTTVSVPVAKRVPFGTINNNTVTINNTSTGTTNATNPTAATATTGVVKKALPPGVPKGAFALPGLV